MPTLKQLFVLIFILFTTALQGYDVIVSVAPHKYFVERIAGDTLSVGLMVPAGASSHTYEPTPRQMIHMGKADIWFQIGENFETRAGNSLRSHNPNLQLVSLQKGLDLIHEHNCSHCQHAHPSSVDPHFWLSPKQGIIQAHTIAETLIATYPQHRELFEKNLGKFVESLLRLDQEISALLNPIHTRTILVSHPAYAYFCRDYNLTQLSVEFEGKDPTPQQLTNLIQKARELRIKKIYIQIQYSNKGAKLIAQQLGAELITLNPYAEEYEKMMLDIAKAFADQ